MERSKAVAKTKEQVVLELWRRLDTPTIGSAELNLIQTELKRALDQELTESPAAIARTLADHGALLRHPEVMECDHQWRRRKTFQLFGPDELNFASLSDATTSLAKCEQLREEFEGAGDLIGVRQLRDLVLGYRTELKLIANSEVADAAARKIATEVEMWLGVWLETPDVFFHWLELRQEVLKGSEELSDK